jgi:hypothetical protein
VGDSAEHADAAAVDNGLVAQRIQRRVVGRGGRRNEVVQQELHPFAVAPPQVLDGADLVWATSERIRYICIIRCTLTAPIHQSLRLPRLRPPALVEAAFGIHAVSMVATLDTECASVERLGEVTATAFTEHPDHRIITSFVTATTFGRRATTRAGCNRCRNDAPTGSGMTRTATINLRPKIH